MISLIELNLRRLDPDALLSVLDHLHMEHRLLANSALDVHVQRVVLGDLIINAGDYHFPVFVTGSIPHRYVHIRDLRGTTTGEVRVNYRLLPMNCLLEQAAGEAYGVTPAVYQASG